MLVRADPLLGELPDRGPHVALLGSEQMHDHVPVIEQLPAGVGLSLTSRFGRPRLGGDLPLHHVRQRFELTRRLRRRDHEIVRESGDPADIQHHDRLRLQLGQRVGDMASKLRSLQALRPLSGSRARDRSAAQQAGV